MLLLQNQTERERIKQSRSLDVKAFSYNQHSLLLHDSIVGLGGFISDGLYKSSTGSERIYKHTHTERKSSKVWVEKEKAII
jgi:hypothetical protein